MAVNKSFFSKILASSVTTNKKLFLTPNEPKHPTHSHFCLLDLSIQVGIKWEVIWKEENISEPGVMG